MVIAVLFSVILCQLSLRLGIEVLSIYGVNEMFAWYHLKNKV